MDLEKIKQLIEVLEKTEITRFVYREKSVEIELERGGHRKGEAASFHPPFAPFMYPPYQTQPEILAAKQPTATVEPEVKTVTIAAPMIGIFYHARKPGDPPLVSEGQRVKKGDIIGLIEAMKTFYEVKATVDGEVVRVHVKDQDRVDLATKIIDVLPEQE